MSHFLRPLTLDEIQDGARAVYRKNFRFFFAAGLVPLLPLTAAWCYAILAAGDPAWVPWAGYALSVPAIALAWGALVHAVGEEAEGRPVVPRESLRAAGRRALPLLGATLLAHFFVGAGLMILVAPGILALVSLFLVWPVVMFEGKGAGEAGARSRQLVDAVWGTLPWFVLGVLLEVVAASLFVVMGGGVMVMVLTLYPGPAAVWALAVTVALGVLLAARKVPFLVAVSTLVYFDRWARTEGVTGVEEAAEAPVSAPPPPPELPVAAAAGPQDVSDAHLRPLTAAEIVDGARASYLKNRRFFLAAGLGSVLPLAAGWGLWLLPFGGFAPWAGYALSIPAMAVAWGAVAHAVGEEAQGRPVVPDESLRAVRSRIDSLLAAMLLTYFLVGVGLLLMVVPGVLALVFLFATVPAVVFERKGVPEAAARSWKLVEGAWRPVSGTVLSLLVAAALPSLLVLGAALVVSSAVLLFSSLRLLSTGEVDGTLYGVLDWAFALAPVLAALVAARGVPLLAAGFTLLYLDRRARTGGVGEAEPAEETVPAPA